MTAPDRELEPCSHCNGFGEEYYSDCCGAALLIKGDVTRYHVCSDCLLPCDMESEKCERCVDGHTSPPDDKDDYTDIRIEETFLNRGV